MKSPKGNWFIEQEARDLRHVLSAVVLPAVKRHVVIVFSDRINEALVAAVVGRRTNQTESD